MSDRRLRQGQLSMERQPEPERPPPPPLDRDEDDDNVYGSDSDGADEGSRDDPSWDARTLRMAAKLPAPADRAGTASARRPLRDALARLQPAGAAPLKTLHAIIRRCIEEPGEDRWRRLRLENHRVEKEIVAHDGGLDFLKAAAFKPAEFGTVLVLAPLFGQPEAIEQLRLAVAALTAAAAALPEPLELPVVNFGRSIRASVGLASVLASDDLRRAVIPHSIPPQIPSNSLVCYSVFPSTVRCSPR